MRSSFRGRRHRVRDRTGGHRHRRHGPFPAVVGYAIVGFTFVAAGAVQLTRNLAFAAGAVAVLAVGIPTAAVLAGDTETAFRRWSFAVSPGSDRAVRTSCPMVTAVPRRLSPHVTAGLSSPSSASRPTGGRSSRPLGSQRLAGLPVGVAVDVAVRRWGTVPVEVVCLSSQSGAIASDVPLPGGSEA